ncbi:MAG TPA: M15 family metallopeptidase [Acidimicrobiales bacterium]
MRRAGAVLAVAAAAVAGVVAGATLMAGVQGAGSRDHGPPAPQTADAAGGAAGAATTPPPADPAPLVLLAWTPNGLDPGLAAAAAADPAVTATSVVRGATIDLAGSRDAGGASVDRPAPGWAIPLDVVAVDPAAHAGFVSVADREAIAGLGEGEALLGTTSARLRRLGPGGVLDLTGGHSVTVAAVVSDSAVGGAELAVDRATGERLGVATDRYVLSAYDGDRPALEQRLRAALTTATAVRFRGLGETAFLRNGDAVLPQAYIKDRFGEFAYRRVGPGDEFEQDPGWQAEHLVTVDLPVIGPARCHRLVVDALAGALSEVAGANLAGLIGPDGFAGCWNPRTTRGGAGISRHAWGVAVDVNTGDNPTGLASVQDPRLVAIFGRWGFTEGSGWLVPDAGHFEYVAPPGG